MALSICDPVSVMDETGKEITQRGTPLFPISCYFENVSEMPVPWHWHDELEMLLVTKGEAELFASTGKLVLHTGEGVFINTEVLHSVVAHTKEMCEIKSICWQPHLTGGREDSIFWQKYTKPLLDNRMISYIKIEAKTEAGIREKELLMSVWRKCVEEPSEYEIDVRYELSKLIISLMGRERENAGYKKYSEKNMRKEKRLKEMLSLIHLHYGEELTVKRIADAASISVSEAMRCFKATLGTSPIQYLKKYRLEKAASMLGSELTISEIGAKCGFDDISYFGKEFKRIYGLSPSAWRKSHVDI